MQFQCWIDQKCNCKSWIWNEVKLRKSTWSTFSSRPTDGCQLMWMYALTNLTSHAPKVREKNPDYLFPRPTVLLASTRISIVWCHPGEILFPAEVKFCDIFWALPSGPQEEQIWYFKNENTKLQNCLLRMLINNFYVIWCCKLWHLMTIC